MYVTPAKVRAMALKMTAAAEPSATNAAVLDLIERASRMFDKACGVAPEYFEPALHPVWESLHEYAVGDIVTPTTPNAHIYRVTTAGTSGATEPTWPASSTVTNGSVTFTEYGADVVATSQVIYGDGTNYLRLPPYVPGTLNATITLPDGYTAPDFVERDGYLVRTSTTGVLPPVPPYHPFGWYQGVAVTVSAKWGYSETPADVQQAVLELAINLWRETDPANLKLTNLDNQPLRESLPPRVMQVVKGYRQTQAAFV
jgi:hypothetical protein